MTELQTMMDVMVDIFTKGGGYAIDDILKDEEFIKYKQLAFTRYANWDPIKAMIIKYDYTPVNDVLKYMLKASSEQDWTVKELITDLRSGYDKDPEQAHKELDRLNDLCAEAADALEVLK